MHRTQLNSHDSRSSPLPLRLRQRFEDEPAIATFFSILWTLLLLVTPRALPDVRPPNVVLIVADDLGYRELGCYGQKKIRTPNIDRLASSGLRFTQAYSGNAVCAPSRCVLMTGKHPGHAWIRNNRAERPEGQTPLPSQEVTVAETLASAGYTSGAFGKWGLGPPQSEGDPLRQGFQRFFGYNCQRHAHSYYPSYLWSDQQRVALENTPSVPGHASLPAGAPPNDPKSYASFQGSDYAPDRIRDAALKFVRDNKDRPFFLFYPTVIPHLALHIPQEHLSPYLALGWHDPPFTRPDGGYTPHFTPRAAYAAMITHMDRSVGKLLGLIDELELTENTVVMFTSDNGTTHLKEEVDYDFFASVGKLRGLKGSLYEGGIRVPLVVRWPGKTIAGTTTDRVVGFEDFLPTIAEIVGIAAPAGIDGISFAPTLRNEPQPPRPFLYREFQGYGGQQSVRFGRWKAVRQGIDSGNLQIELYDLEEDPGETHNIAREHSEIVAQARKILAAQHTRSEIFPLQAIDEDSGRGTDR